MADMGEVFKQHMTAAALARYKELKSEMKLFQTGEANSAKLPVDT